ncbi:chemotaxis protein CheA [Bacillus sp. B-jedd]|uniref:chemotaxis protein CheA n=1 Tax=Bacillus sp. B-jedd TaxID=1476857 RepID=UPI0005156DF4|nr:chemotaxis protein CheA [Bacillus sp. B-jedd]CEG25888.1 sensor histidine kinase CheA [Bacillus sp. B-jedd]
MDMNDYLEMFIEESKEHLQVINKELLRLEAEPEHIGIINEIFRSAHTLKGMAASMGFEDLASLTHQMENVLDLLRNTKLTITADIMDVIFKCVDIIERMVENIEQGGDGKEDVSHMVGLLQGIQNPEKAVPTAIQEAAVTAEMEIVTDLKTDSVLPEYLSSALEYAKMTGHQLYEVKVTIDEKSIMKSVRAYMVFQAVEEMGDIVQAIPSAEQIEEGDFEDSFTLFVLTEQDPSHLKTHLLNISEVRNVTVMERLVQELEETSSVQQKVKEDQKKAGRPEAAKESEKKKHRSKSIRVDIDKLDHLMNLFSELIIDRGRLEQIARKTEHSELTETVEHMTRISTDLQGLILNMRMVPVEQVFNRFPRMVRDLAKELNKKVQLVIEGAETELDRTVIDEISDPLVHLLRNALDHGLESTEERRLSNKPEEGKIVLKAYHGGNHVFIEVADDGKGINRDKVLEKAIERGVVTEEAAATLTDQQIFSLIFASGFSTADKISDISGRGVGLDVVKTKIESLGGTITIDSIPGQGSTFRIQLPLTLSIIFSMLVKVEEETYAIPFSSIVEITTVGKDQVSALYEQKVIQFRGNIVPLVYLKDAFQIPSATTVVEQNQLYIVIVRKGDKTVGLVVDSVLGQQEVVLKSLGSFLNNLYAISGATILGTGEVALIIDSNQFV